MKNIFFILFICFTIGACTDKSQDTSKAQTTPPSLEKALAQSGLSIIPINASFPFGCVDLIKYKYPKFWKGDLENYGHLIQPEGKEFENIYLCFEALNKVESKKLNTEDFEITHLKIGKDFIDTLYFDTIAQRRIDSLKYRLPDIGNYQRYYFYQPSVSSILGEYCSLLLLDTVAKTGQTINIYYRVAGEQHIAYRYFFMDNDVIKIFEGFCYDDGCNLSEKYSISLKPNQVVIKEL